jgi:hypothetical protein
MAYGRLWWLFDDPQTRAGGPLQGGYAALGAYGQCIVVIPKLDMVIAHKVAQDTGPGAGRTMAICRQLVDAVLDARE